MAGQSAVEEDMADRGGSGYAQLRGIAEELDQLRLQLARAKRPPGAEEEQRLMRQELAAIREHLRRLGEQLAKANGPSEPTPPPG